MDRAGREAGQRYGSLESDSSEYIQRRTYTDTAPGNYRRLYLIHLYIWTLSQPDPVAQAWHKKNGEWFLRSLRRWDTQERYYLDISLAVHGNSDWHDALGVVNYALLPHDVSDAVHWGSTGNDAVNVEADTGDVCGGGHTWYPGTINIRIHPINNAIAQCGGTVWDPVRHVNTSSGCAVQGVQHTNHEMRQVLSLADPDANHGCPGYWSVMHRQIGYGCTDTRWPTYDTYYPNDIGSVSVLIYAQGPQQNRTGGG